MVTDSRERFNADKLRVFSSKAFQKLGVPKKDADTTGEMLVACDLRGVESHGVAHLAGFYCQWIKEGKVNPTPKLNIISKTATTATLNGDKGLGFVVGHRAMTEAIEMAKKYGSGFVNVTNSTHFGATSYYSMMAMKQDMIGLAMTSTMPAVVVPGTTVPVIGTNPLAVAVPAGKKSPFVLDMATSVVAGGKVEIARRQGKMIPEGWVVDSEGKPVTDPNKLIPRQPTGGLLPLGGTPALGSFKGFGLGIFVDICTCLLAGLDFTLLKEREPGENPSDFFFGAIKIDGFQPIDQFKQKMDNMIEKIESLPTLPGVQKAYVAGGFEGEVIVPDRKANGIPLDTAVIQSLKDLAQELGIEYDIK
jgi:LDH2 family malate/lactate/ureidoglycolate dehydrogenase